MDDLLLHPQTRQSLERFLRQPSHALLLTGQQGAGKGTLAQYAIRHALQLPADKPLQEYPYYFHAAPVKGTVSIDTIRGLHDFLRLRTTGRGAIRRAVLLENAHGMTIEAQNAFLKLLEEPPADTMLVLTAAGEQSLLPTIYSRLQKITVKSAGKDASVYYFTDQGFQPTAVHKAFYISDGQAGLMHALLHDEAGHPLATSIAQAKELMTLPVFDRLVRADSLSKQKEELPMLLLALERLSHAGLTQAGERGKPADIRTWHAALKRTVLARQMLARNPQAKLLLTDLFMAL